MAHQMYKQRNVRGIATAALVAVVVLFAFSSYMSHHFGGWGWAALRAFAEAATVGALADWFAVVALFRHPLGIPIPHTAVLVRKQDSIAKSIADFFCDNFWVAEQVRARVLTLQPASAFVQAAGQQNGVLTSLLTGLRRTLAEQLRNRAVISQLSDVLTKLLPSLPLADAVRGLVRAVEKSQLPSAAVEMMVNEAATYVNTHRTDIRQEVIACFRAAKPSVGKGAGAVVGDIAGFVGDVVDTAILPFPDIDSRLASGKRSFFGNVLEKVAGNAARGVGGVVDKVADGGLDLVADMATDAICKYVNTVKAEPEHSLRQKLATAIRDTLSAVGNGTRYGEELADALNSLTVPAVDTILRELPQLLEDSQGHPSDSEDKLLSKLANGLQENPQLAATCNETLANLAAGFVSNTRDAIASELENTIRAWDMNTMVAKIEEHVGNDLQYIRLNGTFVGGLIGLLIFAITNIIVLF